MTNAFSQDTLADEYCGYLSALAEIIMKARIAGVSKEEALSIAEKKEVYPTYYQFVRGRYTVTIGSGHLGKKKYTIIQSRSNF